MYFVSFGVSVCTIAARCAGVRVRKYAKYGCEPLVGGDGNVVFMLHLAIEVYIQRFPEHADVFADQFQSAVDHLTLIPILTCLVAFPVAYRHNLCSPVGIADQAFDDPIRVDFCSSGACLIGLFQCFLDHNI